MDSSKTMWLNKLILDVAIRANVDWLEGIDVYWKAIGRYGIVVVVDCEDKWWYRIFDVQDDEYQYDQAQVFVSINRTDDPDYIYGYYCDLNSGEQFLQKVQPGEWYERVIALALEDLEIS